MGGAVKGLFVAKESEAVLAQSEFEADCVCWFSLDAALEARVELKSFDAVAALAAILWQAAEEDSWFADEEQAMYQEKWAGLRARFLSACDGALQRNNDEIEAMQLDAARWETNALVTSILKEEEWDRVVSGAEAVKAAQQAEIAAAVGGLQEAMATRQAEVEAAEALWARNLARCGY
tara:strand:- start:13822 stop:14355 length:534 start_codon:yes stop_codon:yes gene_type:complete